MANEFLVLDSTGESYKDVVSTAYYPAPKIVVLDSTGNSYFQELQEGYSLEIFVLDSTGASYKETVLLEDYSPVKKANTGIHLTTYFQWSDAYIYRNLQLYWQQRPYFETYKTLHWWGRAYWETRTKTFHWQSLAVVSTTTIFQWHVRNDVLVYLFPRRFTFKWDAAAFTNKQSTLQWLDAVFTNKESSFKWEISGKVSLMMSATYDILSGRPTFPLGRTTILRFAMPTLVPVTKTTTVVYADAALVYKTITLRYTSSTVANPTLEIKYSDATRTTKSSTFSYVSSTVASTTHTYTWSIREGVTKIISCTYDLSLTNPVFVRRDFGWSIEDNSVQSIQTSPILYKGDSEIDFISIDMSCDEGSPYWIGSVDLAEIADYVSLSVQDEVRVEFNSNVFNMIVDGKQVSRGDNADSQYQITLISPAALLDSPFASTITKIYSTATLASTIVADLVGTVDWQLFDWYVPVEQCQWVDETPMAIAKKIVKAIGGLLESNPDGTLLARKIYPISPPAYAVTHCTTLNDYEMFSVKEDIAPQALFNRVNIYNQPISNSGVNDTVEYVQDEDTNLSGVIHGYPSPVRNVNLVHTGNPATVISKIGDYTRTETETVEFLSGKAQTRYPVASISAVTWNATNLGGVSFAGKTLTSAIAGESLLIITYVVASKKFDVSGVADSTVQFVLCDA